MKKAWNACLRAGFTLIEVLVTVVIIGVLAAVIIPAITNQIGAADPARVANDLANVRTGIETFSLNVRPRFPGDLDDLANPITPLDLDIKGVAYTDTTAWNGPYISATVPKVDGSAPLADIASNSGYKASILSRLASCSSAAGTTGVGCVLTTAPQFVTVQISGLDAPQFRAINDVLDGASDSLTASTTGKFRFDGTRAYFLATPYR
ncbi:MAG: prepilin-type N-terminal cleavage/methylation domain-containing protein [Gemmatimonadaceae bacterium]|nr:prepilin-type N-terminal cleavage/methylation domain-containing protein [Gemmatimonadaceae bacterium]